MRNRLQDTFAIIILALAGFTLLSPAIKDFVAANSWMHWVILAAAFFLAALFAAMLSWNIEMGKGFLRIGLMGLGLLAAVWLFLREFLVLIAQHDWLWAFVGSFATIAIYYFVKAVRNTRQAQLYSGTRERFPEK
ncbi:MAG: hypothetical protein Q8O05_02430 [Chloroflexota bacterium]|nr:hypothetical protein [Chloroflexota bacterium]